MNASLPPLPYCCLLRPNLSPWNLLWKTKHYRALNVLCATPPESCNLSALALKSVISWLKKKFSWRSYCLSTEESLLSLHEPLMMCSPILPKGLQSSLQYQPPYLIAQVPAHLAFILLRIDYSSLPLQESTVCMDRWFSLTSLDGWRWGECHMLQMKYLILPFLLWTNCLQLYRWNSCPGARICLVWQQQDDLTFPVSSILQTPNSRFPTFNAPLISLANAPLECLLPLFLTIQQCHYKLPQNSWSYWYPKKWPYWFSCQSWSLPVYTTIVSCFLSQSCKRADQYVPEPEKWFEAKTRPEN